LDRGTPTIAASVRGSVIRPPPPATVASSGEGAAIISDTTGAVVPPCSPDLKLDLAGSIASVRHPESPVAARSRDVPSPPRSAPAPPLRSGSSLSSRQRAAPLEPQRRSRHAGALIVPMTWLRWHHAVPHTSPKTRIQFPPMIFSTRVAECPRARSWSAISSSRRGVLRSFTNM
jgi:hypothetical protein